MHVLQSIGLFVTAALAEIGGAWLVWQGVREHRGVVFIGLGIMALAAYGFVATFQPDPHSTRGPHSWSGGPRRARPQCATADLTCVKDFTHGQAYRCVSARCAGSHAPR